jgi:hypothetical protein
LELAGGEELSIRDDDGVTDPRPPFSPEWWREPRPPIPITVQDSASISDGGVLRFIFESDPWDSLISFESDIPVTLGGTVDLTFAADVDITTQVGRTFDLFDWTGVEPTGQFSIASPYVWDTSQLYTAGEVTLTAVPEPTTAALLIISAIGYGLLYRNRLRRGGRTAQHSPRPSALPTSRRNW